jgi:Putative beta-barrel porin-2, OmpL-like. bbp2
MRSRVSLLTIPVLLSSFGVAAVAADLPAASATPAAPSLTDVLASSGIAATGYISASYEHFSGVPTYRQFDINKNSFSLNQAGVQLAYQPKEGFGGVVQLAAGNDASIVNAAEGSSGSNFDALQAYAQYAKGGWTFIGGKFLTLVGAEVIAPTGNANVSRSFTFFTEPLTHTGLRTTFAASDQVNLIFGVNNGWNIVHDNNTSKTIEFGASFTPNKMWSFALQGYTGKEPVSSTLDGTRSIVDFVGTWNATDALTVILNYDWGRQEELPIADSTATTSGSWTAGALYVNYTIDPIWRVSVRAELLSDKDGFQTGAAQKLKEGTVTFGWMPMKNFELRLEGRYDKSDQTTFVKDVSVYPVGTTHDDKQSSVAVEGLFKF